MLKSKYRLKKRKTFNYIYRHGKSAGCDCLTLIYISAKMKDTDLRVGFSVSKKVGNSVVRHRTVRKMREAVKPFIEKIKPWHNLIFVAKELARDKSVAELSAAIELVLKKTGLLL